jgi:hypothetical protein
MALPYVLLWGNENGIFGFILVALLKVTVHETRNMFVTVARL